MEMFLFLITSSFYQCSTRVSNELGAGRPQTARLAVIAAICIVVTEAFLAVTTMISGRHFWGYCYSNEERVVKYVGEMLLLLPISHSIDGLVTVLSGIFLQK